MNPTFDEKIFTGAQLVDLALKQYVQFNPKAPATAAASSRAAVVPSPLLAKVLAQRANEDADVGVGIIDRYRTILVMLNLRRTGRTGTTCTPWHVDRTEAYNWAVGIGDKHPRYLAYWLFVSPENADALDAALKQLKKGKGLADAAGFPTANEIAALRRIMGHDKLIEVRQFAGDLVWVPPGWVHCVRTDEACLKLAWDFWDPAHALDYVTSWMGIVSKLFGKAQGADYINVLGVLADSLKSGHAR